VDNIIVRSNDPIADEKVNAVGSEPEKAAPAEETKQEQKIESTDSETVETEQEDESEELLESKDDGEETEKTKAKKKGGFKRRIDKLNARVAERERELEYWRAEALKAKEAKPSEQPKQVTKETSGKPDPNNFDTHAEYVEALTDWKVSQRYAEKEALENKTRMQIEQEKALKSHLDRVKSYSEKNPDFQELLDEVDDVPMSFAVQDLIVTSENGPALMHELAKNRAVFESICKMSPIAAARAIGAIEAKIASLGSEENLTKKTTTAPKPLSSVASGKSVVTKRLDDPNISQREYERLRAEQMRNRA